MKKNRGFCPQCLTLNAWQKHKEKTMNLKDLRKQFGLSQIEMAKILGMKQQNYSREENGDSILSIKNAIKIANHFHISLDQIYNDYITPEEREQGVIDFTQIVVNAGEYEIISIYRAIGEKIGKGGQEAYREFGNTLLENLK